MSDVTVTLGGIQLQGFELPEAMPWGGDQLVAVHKLIGGQRVIDALGRDDAPLEWTARFIGSDAIARARSVDALRIAGAPISLTWSEFSYTVVLTKFRPKYRAENWLDYDCTCEVVSDDANPSSTDASPSLNDQVTDDASTASDLGDTIGDPTLSGQVDTLQTAVAGVPDFTNASTAALAPVSAALGAAQGQVAELMDAAQATLQAPLGTDPISIAANLDAQAEAATQLPSLYAVGSVLSRMASNVVAAGVGGSSETTVGGDLSFIAAGVYGDATSWTTIARANGLTDPVLAGVNTLVIPPVPDGAGGVLIQ